MVKEDAGDVYDSNYELDKFLMSLRATLVGVLIAFTFIVMILFVLFGQVTVRKLRKNPQTKNHFQIPQGLTKLFRTKLFSCI